MIQIALIGIGAGVAAALLFASVSSGSWLSVPLFYLAPLPVMIASLGWSHWAGLIAALAGSLALGVAFSSMLLLAFLASAGIPAWWLGYLAMLARPAGNEAAPALEWYPPGRLVVWASLLAALVVIIAITNFGFDADSFRAGLGRALARLLHAETGETPDAPLKIPGVEKPQRLLDFLVITIPPAAAVLATVTNVLNLWLAGRVVMFSRRLGRPWPDLSAMTFPRAVTAALAIAMGLSLVGGLTGIIAGVLAASLLMAYGVLGFAVLHAVTQKMAARGFLLGGTYAAVLVFGWPVLALCLLGLIDNAFDLRHRIARKRGPPVV
jgi:hypothetical protein